LLLHGFLPDKQTPLGFQQRCNRVADQRRQFDNQCLDFMSELLGSGNTEIDSETLQYAP
jgi:hypothetical protein